MIADHDHGPQTKLRTGESIISTRIWVFMGVEILPGTCKHKIMLSMLYLTLFVENLEVLPGTDQDLHYFH